RSVTDRLQPGRFVYEKLMAMRPENLQVGQPRAAKPVAGFSRALEFDVSYSVRGVLHRGMAKCNIQTAYDTAVMASGRVMRTGCHRSRIRFRRPTALPSECGASWRRICKIPRPMPKPPGIIGSGRSGIG